MIDWLTPGPLFNPVTAPLDSLLTGWEILAGPLGLLLFLFFAPLTRLAGRFAPAAALLVSGAAWVTLTAGPASLLALATWACGAAAWIILLADRRRSGALSERAMITLTWFGLTLLLLPLWLHPQVYWNGWGGSRMAALHNLGFAYFYLRLISWGVDWAKNPADPLRPLETAAWLAYAPCMRLGPVVLRRDFLQRFDNWTPRARADWAAIARRLGGFLLGGVGIALTMRLIPQVRPGMTDYFAAPADYPTGALLAVFYFVPIQVYLILWSYNELAAALALWVGIPVDQNFDWLPLARSVREFWRRWHITIGRWLVQYVYIPVGGNRVLPWISFSAVFGFCAVWHGASWSFLVWGASQVLALCIQKAWDRWRERRGVNAPTGVAWIAFSWMLTMHYQLATVMIFADFQHMGLRLFGELLRRATQTLQG